MACCICENSDLKFGSGTTRFVFVYEIGMGNLKFRYSYSRLGGPEMLKWKKLPKNMLKLDIQFLLKNDYYLINNKQNMLN